jgi:hypothetical protein
LLLTKANAGAPRKNIGGGAIGDTVASKYLILESLIRCKSSYYIVSHEQSRSPLDEGTAFFWLCQARAELYVVPVNVLRLVTVHAVVRHAMNATVFVFQRVSVWGIRNRERPVAATASEVERESVDLAFGLHGEFARWFLFVFDNHKIGC